NLIAVFVLAVLVVLVVLLRRRYPLQVNSTHLGLNGDSGYVFLLEIEHLLRLRGALFAGRQLALVEPDEGAEAEDDHQQDEQRTGAHGTLPPAAEEHRGAQRDGEDRQRRRQQIDPAYLVARQ